MKTPKHATSPSFEATPFEAKEALNDGNEGPLAHYLSDLAEGLTLLAETTNSGGAKAAVKKKKTESLEQEEEDWDGSLDQFEVALSINQKELIASYLREASKILAQLSRNLDPDIRTKDWMLAFKRAKAGKPADTKKKKLFKESDIYSALKRNLKMYDKVEAAIAATESEQGVSRAEVFRVQKKYEDRVKKAGKKAKSHKKT
jgi:hypothetical protein